MSAGSSRIPLPADGQPGGQRADAVRNRAQILDVARDAYSRQGVDVPMAAVARRAGVGVATLYRHFPTREALIREVFAEQFTTCVGALDEALADPDPWRGFVLLVEKLCAMQAADRGFTAAFLAMFPDAVDHDRRRDLAEHGFAALTRRAKAAGRLRADFAQADLVLLLVANNAVAALSPAHAAAASRRLTAYLLQSFRAEPAAPLPPPPDLGLHHLLAPPAGRGQG
ncbi:TetR family transcriptional regulator [Catellatospora methionotrophica]|uniref:TetR family transcriptional regulator n=1 Tax=Catellatospora methionotrophica TaxID=121620 RepID=A0A8J3LGW1_9ACTN|nr:TetR/AcrR family transcriptional regulator [Catellatospora methionotrophica]GIG14946.1 TetR family transcriptional regulator [Catellatospora methionotrophica]